MEMACDGLTVPPSDDTNDLEVPRSFESSSAWWTSDVWC